MKNISFAVLCARFLTPLQRCRVCTEINSDKPEDGQQEYKTEVLVDLDVLLIDAEESLELETNKEAKASLGMLIAALIDYKKACFNCDCKTPTMLDIYNEVKAEFKVCEEQTSGEKKGVKSKASSLYCVKSNQ